MTEPVTKSGQYKRAHPEKAREYQRRDNAKRSKAKQEAWRGVCVDCGGETSRPTAERCRACWRVEERKDRMSTSFYGVGSRSHSRRPDRSKLPLTDIQAEALNALSDEPASPRVLASRCSLTWRQAQEAAYALTAKGLAVRTGGGWRKA